MVKGTLSETLDKIHKKGFHRLYIDGGVTIQSFLKKDLIDEMVITVFPIEFGGVTFVSGHFIYVDTDGILVSEANVLK